MACDNDTRSALGRGDTARPRLREQLAAASEVRKKRSRMPAHHTKQGLWTTWALWTNCATQLPHCKMHLPACEPQYGEHFCNRFDACKRQKQPTAPLTAQMLPPARSNEARKVVPNCWQRSSEAIGSSCYRLLQCARRVSRPARDTPALPPDELAERKRQRTCAKVRQGELSRAGQVLTVCEATWAALTNPARRPLRDRSKHPYHQPSQYLKLLLQDGQAIELLAEAFTLLAQTRVPAKVCKARAKHSLWFASPPCAKRMESPRVVCFVASFRKHSPGSRPTSSTMHEAIPVRAAGSSWN